MPLPRVADIIVDRLYRGGIDTVFTVTGGGAMFLNDAMAVHPHMRTLCNHHEQACAMGAVAYAKYRNNYAAAILTTGCGSTNAITGLLDAWQDNVSCIFVSGQVKRKETSHNAPVRLRQFGVQEADIISVVKSLTKYSIVLNEPKDVLYEIDKSMWIARNGRPGPVWIDVPLDVQGAVVDPELVRAFTPPQHASKALSLEVLNEIAQSLAAAERPVIIAGNGIRLGGACDLFTQFVEKTKIPCVVSYLGVDLLPSEHPQYVGRAGVKGDRAGNFAIQNSDYVLVLGCRLSVALTGFEYSAFAREAHVTVVDIDPEEHSKGTVRIDSFIHADIKAFLQGFAMPASSPHRTEWGLKCRRWRDKWPVCLPEYAHAVDGVNKYLFIERLSKYLKDDSVVVSDAGSAYYVTSQGLKIRSRQRYVTSGAQADMGFTLPAAIGVSVAGGGAEVIGITGDGSLQMNIQELQTVVHHNLPVKLVVWNNNGYLSIRATQAKFFNGREIGTDSRSGISFPSTEKIAAAYGLPFMRVSAPEELDSALQKMMIAPGPIILEVMNPPNQEVVPTASSARLPDGRMVSKPLEDMYPFLDREEFAANMIVKQLDD